MSQYPVLQGSGRRFALRLSAILAVVLILWFLSTKNINLLPISCASGATNSQTTPPSQSPPPQGTPATDSTNFPLTENPISESGKWINGQSVGLDWKDVQTTPGFSFGTQTGAAGTFDDSTAVLTGTWDSDQSAQATVACPTQVGGQEVELRLRTSISAHRITGYELNFSCGGTKYQQIVRWNGALGDFTQLAGVNSSVKTGDIVKATVVGNTITGYVNGVMKTQAVDGTFTTGSPGVGFWRDGGGVNSNFGFSTFSAVSAH
jgi:hypothetical protein